MVVVVVEEEEGVGVGLNEVRSEDEGVRATTATTATTTMADVQLEPRNRRQDRGYA